MEKNLPSFNKSCEVVYCDGTITTGYVDFGEDELPVWFDLAGYVIPDQEVILWKYLCRNCDGSGLFYQMEDVPCTCVEDN